MYPVDFEKIKKLEKRLGIDIYGLSPKLDKMYDEYSMTASPEGKLSYGEFKNKVLEQMMITDITEEERRRMERCRSPSEIRTPQSQPVQPQTQQNTQYWVQVRNDGIIEADSTTAGRIPFLMFIARNANETYKKYCHYYTP